MQEPIEELERLQARTAAGIAAKVLAFARTLAAGADYRPAAGALRRGIFEAMRYADLLGRRRVLLEADAAKAARGNAQAARNLQEAGVTASGRIRGHLRGYYLRQEMPEGVKAALGAEGPDFTEMIEDLLRRVPRLAGTADEVAKIYSEEHVFAAVFSPEMAVTEAVQRHIVQAQRDGIPTPDAVDVLASMTDWSRWYAETVFRTNVTTAYAAGRWKQVSDPVVQEVVPAFRYTAIGDGDTRPNHEAADGLVAGLNDPIWERFTPPLGYNCRCTLELVDRWELQRLGLVTPSGAVKRAVPANFGQAGPDSDRFGRGRPDRRLYGF